MLPGPYEEVPLSDDDKDMLYTIYDSRRRFLLAVYVFLVSLGIASSYKGVWFFVIRPDKRPQMPVDGFPFYLSSLLFIELIIVSSGLLLLSKRVLPLTKDIKSGVKEKVPFTIVDKQHFPLTNQYFFILDDEKYENHETDMDTYYSLNPGEQVYLYRAKHSKYFFEESGRFTII